METKHRQIVLPVAGKRHVVGEDGAWVRAVRGEDDGADVALRSVGHSRRKCIFGRQDNDKENNEPAPHTNDKENTELAPHTNDKKNKEPAPHNEPQTQRVMCQGTCKVEFGWSVGSQAFYRTQNMQTQRFCLCCAFARRKCKLACADRRYVSKRGKAT